MIITILFATKPFGNRTVGQRDRGGTEGRFLEEGQRDGSCVPSVIEITSDKATR